MNYVSPQTVYLKDYQPVPYLIETVSLIVSLNPEATQVTARLSVKPNDSPGQKQAPLVLDGERLELKAINIDGKPLDKTHFDVSATSLTIAQVPQKPFTLEIVTSCNPTANTE